MVLHVAPTIFITSLCFHCDIHKNDILSPSLHILQTASSKKQKKQECKRILCIVNLHQQIARMI